MMVYQKDQGRSKNERAAGGLNFDGDHAEILLAAEQQCLAPAHVVVDDLIILPAEKLNIARCALA